MLMLVRYFSKQTKAQYMISNLWTEVASLMLIKCVLLCPKINTMTGYVEIQIVYKLIIKHCMFSKEFHVLS